jgi:hypothetical protein
MWKSIGDNKLAVNYLIKFVIKVLFMTPNYVTITITKFHTIWMFVLDIVIACNDHITIEL